ncbi:MAG: AsnC family transcriptional regulator [Pseudomonadales bacterium]|nr:AsnC family transcriptional regulator [Pseudomonadales bacterium]
MPKTAPDRKFRPHNQDRRILEVLTRNARITSRDLACELQIPERIVADRLRVMQSNRIVRATVLLDYSSFGYRPFLNLRLAVDPDQVDAAAAYLIDNENVSTLYSWGRFAKHQFGLHIVARSLEQGQQLLANEIAPCPGARSWEVHIMAGRSSYNPSVVTADTASGRTPPIRPFADIDELDVSIIHSLREQGRKPYQAIAEELGVVEGTVRRRIARLVNDGAIRFAPIISDRNLIYGTAMPSAIWIDVEPGEIEAAAHFLNTVPYIAGVERIFGSRGSFQTGLSMPDDQLEAHLAELTESIPGLRDIIVEPVKEILKFSDTWRDLESVQPLPMDLLSTDPILDGDES